MVVAVLSSTDFHSVPAEGKLNKPLKDWSNDELKQFCSNFQGGQCADQLLAAFGAKNGGQLDAAGKDYVEKYLRKKCDDDDILVGGVVNALFPTEKGEDRTFALHSFL